MSADPDPPPVPAAGHPTRLGVRTTKQRGRLTASDHATLARSGPRWAIEADPPWHGADLAAAFGRSAPRLLDIGVGNGAATTAFAVEHPGWDVVAVEVHRPGIARLLAELDAGVAPNVRVVDHDATALVASLEPAAFHAVRVLFPDPWPKRRHLQRRMVDLAFVARVADALPVGGWFHVATDWDDYAAQVAGALGAEARFGPLERQRPPRPVTTYERRGVAAGRTITDLVARRSEPA